MQKYIDKVVCLIGLIVILTACGVNNLREESNQVGESNKIEIGVMSTLSASIYIIGVEKNFFQQEGIDVELTIFNSSVERDAAVAAGQVDGFMTDIMGAVNLIEKGFPIKVTSREYEDFGIMKNNTVLENAIATVGIGENTVVEYLADQLLESEIEKVNILAIPDRAAALLGENLQMGVFPEPFVSLIATEGLQQISSSAQEGIQPVVLGFTNSFVEQNTKEIRSFYEGYDRAIQYMKVTPYEEYRQILIDYGIVNHEVSKLVSLPIHQYESRQLPSEEDFNSIIEWMISKEMISQKYQFKDVVTDFFTTVNGELS